MIRYFRSKNSYFNLVKKLRLELNEYKRMPVVDLSCGSFFAANIETVVMVNDMHNFHAKLKKDQKELEEKLQDLIKREVAILALEKLCN